MAGEGVGARAGAGVQLQSRVLASDAEAEQDPSDVRSPVALSTAQGMGGRKTVALADVPLLEPDVQEQYGPEHAVMVGQAQHMPSTSYPDPACGQQPPRRKRKRPSATSAPLSSPQQIPKYQLFFGCVERCRYLRSSGQKTEYLLAARLPKQHETGELMLRWFKELPDPATMQQQLIP